MSRRWFRLLVCSGALIALLISGSTLKFVVTIQEASESAATSNQFLQKDGSVPSPQTHHGVVQSVPQQEHAVSDGGPVEPFCHFKPTQEPHAAPVMSPTEMLQSLKALSRNADRSRITSEGAWQQALLANMCNMQFAQGENAYAVSVNALAKASDALQWLRGHGILWNVTKPCRKSSTMSAVMSPGGGPRRTNAVEWKQSIRQLPQLVPYVMSASHRQPETFQQSTFGRVPKKASWLTATNICGSCEPPPGAYYMASRHSCYFTLWGVGEAAKLHKLTSTSRGGRNVIFKERISSYQYGGIVSPQKFAALVDDKGRSFTSSWFVNGTTVWLGPYEFDNPGHVIHDALWTWQLALMLPDIHATDPNRKHARSGDPPIYPSPVRGVFSHDFESLSSDYFGVLSWLVASEERRGAVNVLERSPFPSVSTFDPKRPLVCFEKLVIPGQDRHVDGGGLGLRQIVAKRLRRNVHAALNIDGARHRQRRPHIFIYGRNDVYRRSIDNTDVLLDLVARVAHQHRLPPPRVVQTFAMSPEEQFTMMGDVDVLVAIQGSHLQNSLFMPDDAAVVELAPCRAEFVSFMRRYGKYLDTQMYSYVSLCDNVMINYSEKDAATQNVTLCPQVTGRISDAVEKAVIAVLQRRSLV